jgi:hypothetical protein
LNLDLPGIDGRSSGLVVHHHGWESDHQADHDTLNDHKRYSTPIDLPGGNGLHKRARGSILVRHARRDGSHIEQGKPDRRMHKTGLHIHAEHHTEPDEIDANLFGGWTNQGNNDEGDLKEVEEEDKQEGQHIDEDEEANLPTG